MVSYKTKQVLENSQQKIQKKLVGCYAALKKKNKTKHQTKNQKRSKKI